MSFLLFLIRLKGLRPYKNIMSSSIELSNSEEVKAFPPTVIYIIENNDIFYVGMRTLDYKLEGGTLQIKNREVCVRYKGNPVFSHGGLGSTGGVYGLERWLGKLRGKICDARVARTRPPKSNTSGRIETPVFSRRKRERERERE